MKLKPPVGKSLFWSIHLIDSFKVADSFRNKVFINGSLNHWPTQFIKKNAESFRNKTVLNGETKSSPVTLFGDIFVGGIEQKVNIDNTVSKMYIT